LILAPKCKEILWICPGFIRHGPFLPEKGAKKFPLLIDWQREPML
jgi:hypothetical protein